MNDVNGVKYFWWDFKNKQNFIILIKPACLSVIIKFPQTKNRKNINANSLHICLNDNVYSERQSEVF